MRTDIRWEDDDPVAKLLSGIPRTQRSKLIRSIVTAALIPGGWATLAGSNVAVASSATEQTTSLVETTPEDTPEVGMSQEGTRGFMHGLQRFLDDD